MQFISTISTARGTADAVNEIGKQLSGVELDLAIVFASHHHGPSFNDLIEPLREKLSARSLIGCTGESIIGPDREVERAPAVAVWGARWPGVRTLPFYLDQDDLAGFEKPEDWHERLGVRPEEHPSFIILPDPFAFDVFACLNEMDQVFPGATVVGGISSGAQAAGQNRLFLNDQSLRHGVVGVSLTGPVGISSVVSQGCRPVGQPFVVTKARENVIAELGGRPALEVLQKVYEDADPADRGLIQKGPLLGRVIDARLNQYRPGDFLIHNLMGIVQEHALAVSHGVRPGQTVQFHVRDARTAGDEMRALLSGKIAELGTAPAGGLMFSCNGRGTHLFGKPHHDIGVMNGVAHGCQVAGFFAAGEIGPIGRQTFVHSYTSSLILFSERA